MFNGIYSPAGDVSQPPNPPSGAFADGAFLNIGRVWQIPVGATASGGAAFISNNVGYFRRCRPEAAVEKCAGLVTDLVTVTRTSFNTWTASADASSATTSATDLNALVKFIRGAWRAFGQYRMPFQLTIQCSNSSCQ